MQSRYLSLLFLCCAGLSQVANCAQWAVIAAGSNGWVNYRHQADVCHAYHNLINHGIPASNIITMMYDDIAQNDKNPTPGVIINWPNGTDLYSGVKIDYRREDVTPQNFVAILTGQSELTNGKPVLKSGKNDTVFIYFADHGGPGEICFIDGRLSSSDLMDALKTMNQKKMYGKLLFYMEACESGSMFRNILPSDMNIFAVTAANATQPSYSCYLDENLQTFLGDVFSINWLTSSDAKDLNNILVGKQYEIVKNETTTSYIQEFGDKSIEKMSVAEFQGRKKSSVSYSLNADWCNIGQKIRSEDVPMETLKRKLKVAKSGQEAGKITFEIEKLKMRKDTVSKVIKNIVTRAVNGESELLESVHNNRMELKNYKCYESVTDEIHRKCFNIAHTPEALRKLYLVVNACEQHVPAAKMLEAVRFVCPHPIQLPVSVI